MRTRRGGLKSPPIYSEYFFETWPNVWVLNISLRDVLNVNPYSGVDWDMFK